MFDWEDFLDPYIQAVGELKIKLRGVRKQFRKKNLYSPIEFVTGRVKSVDSIIEKMQRYGYTEPSSVEDLAGLRIMVQFVDDIYEVVDLIKQRQDMEVLYIKDYITRRKESGYRSYHVIVAYPVETIKGRQTVHVEIQIRTLSMNFWATIEHSLNYKYRGNFPEELRHRLTVTARIAGELDEEMRRIRDDIREAQVLFDPVAGSVSDGVGNSDDTDDLFR